MVFVAHPRFERRYALLALAVITPPVLLGALAFALMSLGLATLDVGGGAVGNAEYLRALTEFKEGVELVEITFFVVFGLLTLAALHMTEDAMKGMHIYTLLALVFLVWAVYKGWDFRVGTDATSIGLGIAFWGLGWVLLMVHLYALLRATPHRKWLWVTGAAGLYQAAAFFAALEIGIWISLNAAALLFAVLGLVSAIVLLVHRDLISELWGYGLRRRVELPGVGRRPFLLALLYSATAFALLGAEYVHHFSYIPVFRPTHYVLLAATTPLGVVVFGAITEKAGRRGLLYAVPLAAAIALLAQHGLSAVWPVAVAEGLLLGALPFLFQYLAEISRTLSRGTIFLYSLGAIAALGLGGSFIAQFAAWTDLPPDRILLLEFAGVILALILVPQLPETRAIVTQAEELEDYLDMARRVGSDTSHAQNRE